jgi:hypothetical protein
MMNATLSPLPPERRQGIRAMLVATAGVAEPGRPPVRRRTVALAAATVVATVLVTAALLTRDPAPDPGFAGWTAMPDTALAAAPTRRDMVEWTSQCQKLTGGGVSIEGVRPRRDAGRRPVLVDRRGQYTFCVDITVGKGTAVDPLVAVAGIKGGDVQQSWATVYDRPVHVPTGSAVLVVGGDGGAARTGTQISSSYGLAGADVRGIDLVLAGGTRVTATVRDGRWAAWWPTAVAGTGLTRLVVQTPAGATEVDPATVQLIWEHTGD